MIIISWLDLKEKYPEAVKEFDESYGPIEHYRDLYEYFDDLEIYCHLPVPVWCDIVATASGINHKESRSKYWHWMITKGHAIMGERGWEKRHKSRMEAEISMFIQAFRIREGQLTGNRYRNHFNTLV